MIVMIKAVDKSILAIVSKGPYQNPVINISSIDKFIFVIKPIQVYSLSNIMIEYPMINGIT